MLSIPEFETPRSREVTTNCNCKCEVWNDYEESRSYFLEIMMTADDEEHDLAECVYNQLFLRLEECSDEDE